MADTENTSITPSIRVTKLARSSARHRRPSWKTLFIAKLRDTCVVRLACEAASVSRRGAYAAKKRDAAFSAKWDEALEDATDLLEAEARRRAYEGVAIAKVHEGELVMVPDPDQPAGTPPTEVRMVPLIERRYSDGLMLALLRAHRREKFSDKHKAPDARGTDTTIRSPEERELEAARLLAAIAAAVGAGAPAPADPPAAGGQPDRAGGDQGQP